MERFYSIGALSQSMGRPKKGNNVSNVLGIIEDGALEFQDLCEEYIEEFPELLKANKPQLRQVLKEYARANPPAEMYYRKRDFYFRAPRVTGYISFFRCVAIVLGIAPMYEKQYQKPLSAECREACRKLDRYTDEVTLVCQEHLETPQDIQDYIVRMNAEIDEVTAVRSKIRNKQRNCTDPVQMEELKKKCAACTTVLADLRKKKKTAVNVIEDDPKLRELLESEFEARLENDPYLSDREKRAIREQSSPQREEHDYER